MLAPILLAISNVFMTIAWYGHLKYGRSEAMWKVILVSWLIASLEYCFQVPANRIGYLTYSAFQLKIMQEVISLVIFTGFAVVVLREQLRWNHAVSFALIIGAVFFAFIKKS